MTPSPKVETAEEFFNRLWDHPLDLSDPWFIRQLEERDRAVRREALLGAAEICHQMSFQINPDGWYVCCPGYDVLREAANKLRAEAEKT